MRIVMIGPFAIQPKGTVRVRMIALAQALQTRGHQLRIVLPPYDNIAESEKTYVESNIQIHNIKISRIPLLAHLINALRLIGDALKFKPDTVYVFKPRGESGLAAMLLIFLRWFGAIKVRIVVDTDDWEGRGGFYNYLLEHRLYPKYQLDFIDFQEKWIPKHCDAITVASRALQSQIWGLGVPQEKVFYVPNGPHLFPVPEANLNKEVLKLTLGLANRPVLLLYTRFFEFQVESVIRILVKVKKELEGTCLLVVGKGDFDEEAELLRLAEKEGISKSISIAGWIDHKELLYYLEIGDVAIYPFIDTLLNRAKCPGKLVEMMSLGKAIVADKVGQIAEYIENGNSGILVDPGDIDSFSAQVIRLLKDKDLRIKLGDNARARIWDKFNWDKQVFPVEEALGKPTLK